MLTLGLRHLRPPSLGTLTAAVPPVQGKHLTRLSVHSAPEPGLVRLLLDKARYGIGFHRQALAHDVLLARARLERGADQGVPRNTGRATPPPP